MMLTRHVHGTCLRLSGSGWMQADGDDDPAHVRPTGPTPETGRAGVQQGTN